MKLRGYFRHFDKESNLLIIIEESSKSSLTLPWHGSNVKLTFAKLSENKFVEVFLNARGEAIDMKVI